MDINSYTEIDDLDSEAYLFVNKDFVYYKISNADMLYELKKHILTKVNDYPIITTQPQIDLDSLVEGGQVLLTVECNLTSGVSYQWKKDGITIGTSKSLTINNYSKEKDSGNYSVLITNGVGYAYSDVVQLI